MNSMTPLQRLRHSVPPLIAALAAYGLAVASWRGQMLRDGDTYWHIAAGQWMLAHHAVLHSDIYSFTATGAPWVAHEWLAEIIMAWVYDVAGWSGLVALCGVLAGLTLYLLASHLGRFLGSLGVAALTFFAAFSLLVVLLARPHLLALPIVELWTAELILARAQSRRPGWWLLPFMLLWANLHGGFLLGLALTAAFALEALVAAPADWRKTCLGWGGFGIAATLASMITPNFPDGFLLPFRFVGMSTMFSIIGEWRSPNFQQVDPLEYSVLAFMLFGFARGLKLPVFRLLLLLGLVYSAFQHIRNEILVGLLGPLLIAAALGRHMAAVPVRLAAMGRWGTAALELPVILLIGGIFTAELVHDPVLRHDDQATPGAALDHVPDSLRRLPVLNEYSFAGYLIFSGVRPFIDGRADMYGGDFLKTYIDAASGNSSVLQGVLKQYDIAWTIMPPKSAVVAVLDASPDWERIYSDDVAVVQVRKSINPAP
jgi:hypothetical protein